MNLVFMGTPEFAVPSLQALHRSRHLITAVVTVPDKPAGRGRQLRPSAVKVAALQLGLPILQPDDLHGSEFHDQLAALQADLFFVVGFRILPEAIFTMPPHGTVNLHASLLPKYRGAAPINWALIQGDTETGVTTFFIEKSVDTGNILLQAALPVDETMTAGDLHDQLATLGAELAVRTVDGLEDGTLKATAQTGEITKAPKLTKDLGSIDWQAPAENVHNLIRGLSPFPGCYTTLKDKTIKLLRSRVVSREGKSADPGTILKLGKNGPLEVQTGDGIVELMEVKPEGKKAMSAGEFIRGYRVEAGQRFE